MGRTRLSRSDLEDSRLAKPRLVRDVTVKIGLKLLGVGILDFLLIRIWGPDLINMHSDLALAGAIACFLLAVVAAIGLVFQLWFDLRRFADAKRQIARRPRLQVGKK
jgi:hypothetical protein